MIITPFAAGVGNIVDQIVAEMPEDCSLMCATNRECTAVNYIVSNKLCTLLHVGDVLGDWEASDDDVTYTCVDCDPGL